MNRDCVGELVTVWEDWRMCLMNGDCVGGLGTV
jgi:hypothetical protein